MAGSGVTRLFIVAERRITICPAVQRDRTTRSLSSGAHSRDPLASPGGRRTASGDAIASVARMSDAIDGRHEKKAPACRVSAEIMTGDRCAWRKNSPLGSVCFYQSSPLCKNISVFAHPKSPLSLSPSHPTRGAYHDRHGRRGGMRWTRQRFARDGIAGWVERLVSDIRHADERRFRGRQNRVVLTPRRWRQVSRSLSRPDRAVTKTYPRVDGGKRARSPGRARHKPLKPLRAGMPGDSGVLVYSCAIYQSKARTRPRVQRAPGIPHALFWGEGFMQSSGAQRREILYARLKLGHRHCEERSDEAIHTFF